jgi:hypothetical protein
MYSRAAPALRQALAARTTLRATAPLVSRGMATAPRMLDVAEEIKLDHDNVRDLLERCGSFWCSVQLRADALGFRFMSTTDKNKKGALANTLIREMAVHSDAEEVSVYNDYAAAGLGDVAAHNKGTRCFTPPPSRRLTYVLQRSMRRSRSSYTQPTRPRSSSMITTRS